MHSLFPWLWLPILLGTATPVLANPCAYEIFGGRHVLAGSPQRNIFIKEEKIDVEIRMAPVKLAGERRASFVDVIWVDYVIDYVFENRGPAQNLAMGFPIGRVRNDRVENFQVIDALSQKQLNTSPSTTHRSLQGADLHACELGYFERPGKFGATSSTTHLPPDITKALQQQPKRSTLLRKLPVTANHSWHMWQQPFVANDETRIRVSYRQRSEGDVCSLTYVLSTARHWGDGKIQSLQITATVTGKVPRRLQQKLSAQPAGYRYNRKKQQLRWHLKDHRPAQDLQLVVRNNCG